LKALAKSESEEKLCLHSSSGREKKVKKREKRETRKSGQRRMDKGRETETETETRTQQELILAAHMTT
jgi:hypothetical protein